MRKHEKIKDGRAKNAHNGNISKTVVTDAVGPVDITVPCDRDTSFGPVIVKKRQRRLNDVDEMLLQRSDDWEDHRAFPRDIRGAVSRETAGRITDSAVEETDE